MSYLKLRIENIKRNVSIRSIIDHFNVSCQTAGDQTQVHCPFHSHDSHASARIYETGTMYCFHCSKVWDVLSFVRDFKDLDIHKSCLYIEENFGLQRPDPGEIYTEKETLQVFLAKNEIKNKENIAFDKYFKKISDKLIINRERFSFSVYRQHFSDLDNLFALYRMETSDDSFLKNSLDGLYQKIETFL